MSNKFSHVVSSQEPWLDKLEAKNVRLDCTVYFGSVKMASQTATIQGQNKGITTNNNGSKMYRVGVKFTHRNILLAMYSQCL